MIVSRQIDTSSAPMSIRRRDRLPVMRSVPGSDVKSLQPPVKPAFGTSSRMKTKPFLADPKNPICAKNMVPLKCNQLHSHEEGVSLFNAPVMLIPAALDVPKDKLNGFSDDIAQLIDDVESVMPMFPPDFKYNDGIRSSRRALHFDNIAEPTDPFPDRIAGRPAPYKFQKTTYDVGTLMLRMGEGQR
jgi:hypothetical protein